MLKILEEIKAIIPKNMHWDDDRLHISEVHIISQDGISLHADKIGNWAGLYFGRINGGRKINFEQIAILTAKKDIMPEIKEMINNLKKFH